MILDPCCGSKMFWFDKDNQDVVFGDIRRESYTLCDGRSLEIRPDVQMDFTALPFMGGQFSMVVFDPPHLEHVGKNAWMAKKYGRLGVNWRADLAAGFAECFRVLQLLFNSGRTLPHGRANSLPFSPPFLPSFCTPLLNFKISPHG